MPLIDRLGPTPSYTHVVLLPSCAGPDKEDKIEGQLNGGPEPKLRMLLCRYFFLSATIEAPSPASVLLRQFNENKAVRSMWVRANTATTNIADEMGQTLLGDTCPFCVPRALKDHAKKNATKNTILGISLILGPATQNLRSLLLYGLLGPCTCFARFCPWCKQTSTGSRITGLQAAISMLYLCISRSEAGIIYGSKWPEVCLTYLQTPRQKLGITWILGALSGWITGHHLQFDPPLVASKGRMSYS